MLDVHHQQPSSIDRRYRRVATPLLMAALFVGCDLDPCLNAASCCGSCDDETTLRRNVCHCEADETAATLCPKRSACALAYYVDEGLAVCCRGSCSSTDVFESSTNRCDEGDAYLHECTIESNCFQTRRAQDLGSTYQPWRIDASGSGTGLTAVWAANGSDVWVVGMQGLLLHRLTDGWHPVSSPTTENLSGVWGSTADDVWAIGWNGTILHYDSHDWSSWPSPTVNHLVHLWGRSSTEIWAVGQAGTLLRYDGLTWRTHDIPTDVQLTAVGGDANGSRLWIGGVDGTIWRLDDEAAPWSEESTPASSTIAALWVVDHDHVWAVTYSGELWQRDGERWKTVDAERLQPSLTALWGDNNELWTVGYAGAILRNENSTWDVVSYYAGPYAFDLLGISGAEHSVWAVGTIGIILQLDRP